MKNIVFLLITISLSFSISAQTTCYPGFDDIVVNPGNFLEQDWENNGNVLMGIPITPTQDGLLTHIGYYVGPVGGGAKVAIYSDTNGTPGDLLDLSIGSPSSGIGFDPTPVEVPLYYADVYVEAGTQYWVALKFSGDANFNLMNNADGTGVSFMFGNAYNNPFPTDLSASALGWGTESYAIYMVVEDCVDPVVDGCTDASADNYDSQATEGILWGEVGACSWALQSNLQRSDNDHSGSVDPNDLLELLAYFNQSIPYGHGQDYNNDQQLNAADLLVFLGTFGVTGIAPPPQFPG